jgi:hypothetical protein
MTRGREKMSRDAPADPVLEMIICNVFAKVLCKSAIPFEQSCHFGHPRPRPQPVFAIADHHPPTCDSNPSAIAGFGK